VHSQALERVYGRVVAVAAAFTAVQFWFGSWALSGQRAGSLAADVLVSLLLIWLATRWVSRLPLQRDLHWLAATAGVLLPVSRILAMPGSAFLNEVAYLLVGPVTIAWVVFSRRLVVPIPVLLTILATGAWHFGGDLAVEQSAATLAIAALAGLAAQMMRSGARRADEAAERLTRHIADQDAELAAEHAVQHARYAVHDDVLSVLRAISDPALQLPWKTLVSRVRQARLALARQPTDDGRGNGGLFAVLQRQVMERAAELDVRLDVDGDLCVPAAAAEAIGSAVGEALRNAVAHAGVDSVTVTVRADGSGGTQVTVSDCGIGFDPESVGLASFGLRESIGGRLQDAGGTAEIVSAPGRGTTIVLTLPSIAHPANVGATDPLGWARRLAPVPRRVFLGFMLPPLLGSLVMLCLRWQNLRWHAVALTVFLGLLGLAAASARSVSRVRMTRLAAMTLVAAVTVLAAAGSLAVAPGTADAFAYWVSGETAILITVVYFVRGPTLGLIALAFDLAALTVGLSVTGSAIPHGAWLTILASPVLGAGLAIGFRAAFRSLSRYTEQQLAEYRAGQRSKARAEAVSRVDTAALETARRVAGPIFDSIASGQPPSETLRTAARLASSSLRDELLAPGLLSAALADRVYAARTAGVLVTVDITRQSNSPLTSPARQLLAAALACPDALTDVTLKVHSATGSHPSLLVLHVRGRAPASYIALRECAREYGALVSDLGDDQLLVQLQSSPAVPPNAAP
jgi:signal transduction histidine kinase